MINITASLVKELRLRTGAGIMECKRALIKSGGNIELSIDNLRKSGHAKAEKKNSRITAQGSIFTYVRNNIASILELNCESDFVAKDIEFIAFGKLMVEEACLKQISDINILKKTFEERRILLLLKVGENINITRIALLKSDKIISYIHDCRIGVLVGSRLGSNEEVIKKIAMHIAASKPLFLTKNDIPHDVTDREYKIQLDIATRYKKNKLIIEKIVAGRMNKFFSEITLIGQKFIMDSEKTIGQLLLETYSEVTSFIRFQIGE
ncbi:translation elongation factor Ts [Buchnera aphidicola]|uniref:translation elongation factor Ts n=1 Tax=Buchnera aphidicola TaxID=9 RepID=UPI0034641457